MPSSHLILCHPLILLPPIPPSIRVFSNESTLCMRWPKYWSFSFSIIQRNPRADLLQNGLVGSPCSPRDSQESTPTPQFESIILWCSAFLCTECLLYVVNTFYLICIITLRDRNCDLHFIDREIDLDRSQTDYTMCQLGTALMFCLSLY